MRGQRFAFISKHWYILPALALWIVFYIPFLPYHILHIDESVYILVARKILQGGTPYRDVWDHKPPMVFFLFSFALKMFGAKNYVVLNFITMMFCLFSTVLIYKLARYIVSARIAGLACMFYPVISNVLLERDALNPNTEIYMMSYVLLCVAFTFRYFSGYRVKDMFLAGLSAGMATAFKQPSATILMPVFTAMLLTAFHNRRIIKTLLRGLISFATGGMFVWLAITVYFIANNALPDFLFQCFKFNFIYSSDITKIDMLRGLRRIYTQSFIDLPFFFVPYAIGCISMLSILIWRRIDFKRARLLVFLLFWHLGDIIGMSAGGLFYPHYLVQWMPSFSMITVIGLYLAYKTLFRKYRVAAIICMCFYILFIMRIIFVTGISYRNVETAVYVEYKTPMENWRRMRAYYSVIGDNFLQYPYYRDPKQYYSALNTVKIIRSFVPRDGTIFIWGFIPELYLFADREPSSRFVFTSFVSGRFYGLQNLHIHPKFTRMHLYMETLMLGDLMNHKPNLIVLSDTKRLPSTEGFFKYLDANYRKLSVTSEYPVELFLRKDFVGSVDR
ncbi:MAG: glycosyltransferase family 39 protein [Candidatus Auribacterota bacterium]|jgi:hypothetical protein|nr:glycosyltransferase family 39 protein [Candidatus Auribacterota bacterium]